MHRQLNEILGELESALERVRRLSTTKTNEEWVTQPAEGSWSAAECIAHLNLTSEAFVPLLEGGLEEARRLGGGVAKRFRRDPLGWLIWRTVRPDARMRVKTSAQFVPGGAMDKSVLVEEFGRLQEIQVNALRAADGLSIQRVKVASPFAKGVRYNLYSAFTILAAHQHRHLGQAERAAERVAHARR